MIDRDGLARALERTEILRVFDLRQFQDVLGRANGRRGASRLRSLIDQFEGPGPAKSELERRFQGLCATAAETSV